MLGTLPPVKGLSPYTLTLVRALAKNVEIDFFGFKALYPEFLYPGGTRTGDTEPSIPNVRIRNLLTWYNPFSWIWAGFAITTDILHAQWWSWFLAPVYLVVLGIARLRGKRVILTVHNVDPHERAWWKRALNSSVLRLADEYIVHNEGNRGRFLKKTGTKKPVHVIPHPIIEIQKSSIPREELRKRYGYGSENRVLLFFGNIRPYKGLDILIEAFSLLEDPAARLIVAGKPWEDFRSYRRLIEQGGIESRVQLLLDFIPEAKAAELFKISDLVVFPYRDFDASSGAASLALRFGKASLVTKVGGLPDLVGDPALVAMPGDSQDLLEKMRFALNHQGELEFLMKRNRDLFLPETIALAHINAYRRVGEADSFQD